MQALYSTFKLLGDAAVMIVMANLHYPRDRVLVLCKRVSLINNPSVLPG